MTTAGQIGYEAYAASTGGKTYDGRDMPTWEQVKERTPRVAKAWETAAFAVAARMEPSALADRLVGGFTFGLALEVLKLGKRVARKGWNGNGMWIALTPGSTVHNADARGGAALLLATARADAEGHGNLADVSRPLVIGAHIDMKAADGSLVIGWLASQTDMLASDWCVVSDGEKI